VEQRVYQGSVSADGLARALLDEWDRDDTIAQAFTERGRAVVQIGQREGGWFSDEPHQAITLDIEQASDGLHVTMGQQQWLKDNGVQIFAGGLIGFFPFFLAFPLGQFFGDGAIDQALPGRIWQSIDRYAGNVGAATGKTQRLATIACPECGVANPMGAERCSACGSHLAPTPTCQQCGHVNPAGARFCNRCGTRVEVGGW
jgi:ribosomal protein L40E